MKRLIQNILVLMVVMLIGSAVGKAEDFSVDGIYYEIKSSTDLTVEVTFRGKTYDSYANEYSGSVVIPEMVTYGGKTYSVTSIGGAAFYDCSSLTSVTIPNSVTSIVTSTALTECSSLIVNEGNPVYDSRNNCNAIIETATNTLIVGCKNTNIPNSVTSIGRYAFSSCSSLTSVVIPNSVTSIGRYAFSSCSSLTSVVIPNSVTSIGYEAFYGCSSLTSVVIPNSVTSIGYEAFYGCSSLTSVVISNSVTSIGEWAFGSCTSLTSVIIGNSVTSIGECAFSNCSSLTSIKVNEGNPVYDSRDNCNAIIKTTTNTLVVGCKNTNIPNSVTSIGRYAFRSCTSLTSVVIPESVTSIGNDAFEYCTSLTSVVIPNSVTSIGEWAFCYCTSLTSITIPYSVTSIGQRAFAYSSSLSSVTIQSSVTIPSSVTSIGYEAFYGCSSLTSVVISNSVTSIGEWAFGSCPSLTSVTIGNSVTKIGRYAFGKCSSLTSITVEATTPPAAVDECSFNGCYSAKLLVPQGTLETYRNAAEWKNFTDIEEFEPSGISLPTSVEIDAEESPIYDLKGVRMPRTDNLPSGIYIRDGKKMMVR